MWVQNLNGAYFTARLSDGSYELFRFDPLDGSHKPMQLANDVTIESGIPFEKFGRTLVSATVREADGTSPRGRELWELLPSGGVRLFSDIYPGPDSSDAVVVDGPYIEGYPGLFVVEVAKIDSHQPESVLVFDSGAAIPAGDFLSSFDQLTEVRFPVVFEGRTTFLARGDQSPRVPWTFDADSDQFKILYELTEAVGDYDFFSLKVLGGSLFAKISSVKYGMELWELNEEGVWGLVSDVNPGSEGSDPLYLFEINGSHYYTAISEADGREIYRLDAVEGLVAVEELSPGAGSVNTLGAFAFADAGYFYSPLDGSTSRFFRLDSDGTIDEIDSFPGTDTLPSYIIDADKGTARPTHNGEEIFLIKYGQISVLEAPEGEVKRANIFGNNIFASFLQEDGALEAWVYSIVDEDWRMIANLEGGESYNTIQAFFQNVSSDAYRDIFLGDDSPETITGRAERGAVYARGGDDLIFAGTGAELVNGGAGTDTISYANTPTGVSVGLDAVSNTGGADGDYLLGVENLIGSAWNDSLAGDASANRLEAAEGDDTLDGGVGDDTLVGGNGSDRFVVRRGSGDDTIVDFEVGASPGFGDKIRVLDFRLSYSQIVFEPQADGLRVGLGGETLFLQGVSMSELRPEDFEWLLDQNIATDFDGNGFEDILWRNTDGTIGYWAAQSDGSHSFVRQGKAGPGWEIEGIADFDNNGLDDILWRNADNLVGYWALQEDGSHSFVKDGKAGLDWDIQGTGDFDGNGFEDILWRNTDGTIGYWAAQSDGSHSFVRQGKAGPGWEIEGIADFDNNGLDDILWRNTDNGVVGYWASQEDGSHTFVREGKAGLNWEIQGTGDFDGNGFEDILWRNSDGTVGYWAAQPDGSHGFVRDGKAGLNWEIEGIADFDNNGLDDILWRNTDNGVVGYWASQEDGSHTFVREGKSGLNWDIQHTDEFVF